MSFVDFVVDLTWGTSEFFLAKREARKASNTQAVEGLKGDRRSGLSEAQATREKVERLIGNKIV
jgi:hypothetical protein